MSHPTDPRFVALDPLMHSILHTSSIPGLAYAIIDSGRTIHVSALGHRSLSPPAPITPCTLFPLCSLTKPLNVSLLGILVSRGHFHWSSTITSILPKFRPSDPLLAETTLEELLSHRSGLECFPAWGSDNNLLHAREDSWKICEKLQIRRYQKGKFEYNNWGYEIISHIFPLYCEGKGWGDVLKEWILNPLGCNRTSVSGPAAWDDVTDCFAGFSSSEHPAGPIKVDSPKMSERTIMGISGGVWSCIDDLIIIWGAMMREITSTTRPDEPRVFKDARLDELIAPQAFVPDPKGAEDLHNDIYGMGFFRIMLPNQLLRIGPDYALLSRVSTTKDAAPVVGDTDGTKRLMVGHWGSAAGVSVASFIVPETRSVLVTLMNGTRAAFATDYIVGALMEALFGKSMERGTDWCGWVSRTWDAAVGWGRDMERMVRDRKEASSREGIWEDGDLVGKYLYKDGMIRIDIKRDGEGLLRALFQGREEESFVLEHWEENTLCWFPGMETLLRRGRDDLRSFEYFLLRFGKDRKEMGVQWLEWMYAKPEKIRLIKATL